MRYRGAWLQATALLVAAEPGELFLTQACHRGREPLRLSSLELPHTSDALDIFKATAVSLQVHELLRTVSSPKRMSRLRSWRKLAFDCFPTGKCRAWLGGLQMRAGECLAFHILPAGHSAVLAGSFSRWQQDDSHDEFLHVWSGKFVKWTSEAVGSLGHGGLRLVRAPSRWYFVSPNQDLRFCAWKLRGPRRKEANQVPQSYRDAFHIFERLNPLVPWMPFEMLPHKHPLVRRWLETEPRALSCNSSSDLRWSELRRRMWAWHWADDLRTLPFVPDDVLDLVSSLVDPLTLLEGMNAFMKGIASGAYDRSRDFLAIPLWSTMCILGHISLLFVAVLVSYQAGQPNPDLLQSLYVTVFLQGIWVLLDGQLWPIIAADIVKLNQLHHPPEVGKPLWRPCPCASALREPAGQSTVGSMPNNWNVALVGGHNYVFDIALGLREASIARSVSLNMNLLGYELAEKFAASAEYCELLGDGFCLRDGNVKGLIHVLSKPNHGLEKHHSTLMKSGQPRQVNASVLDLASAREEARRAYLQSAVLQKADFIVCTFPYVLGYLLDEVPELQQPIVLIWQGGSLLEYLHEELHEWARRKLVEWRTRRLFVMNHLDHHWLKRTVGLVPLVPFGARQMHGVLQRQLGNAYAPSSASSKSKQVLVHRMHFILSDAEGTLLKRLMMHHFESKVSGIDLKLDWPPFEIWELINFKAIVLFPWNLEITTFLEFYRLNIPLFVPDSNFMSVLVWSYMVNPALHHVHRFTTIRKEWWQGASCHLQPSPEECAGALPSPIPPWLALENEIPLYQQIYAWWQETDYMKLPHVQHFTGVVHLLQQLHRLDTNSLVKKMRAANLADKIKSASIYEAFLA